MPRRECPTTNGVFDLTRPSLNTMAKEVGPQLLKAALPTMQQALRGGSEKFMAEYETITEGQRSPKWVDGHRARIRLHLMPFFQHLGVSRIGPCEAQDYRVHRIKIGTASRAGDMRTPAKPDPPMKNWLKS